jgi:L-lactate dehydrogenase complex protein LldG
MDTPNISGQENRSARDAILASVRQALTTSKPFDAVHREHHGHAEPRKRADVTVIALNDLIENFKVNLESVGGHCTVVVSENEAAEHVHNLIGQLGATRIAISDSEIVGRIVEGIQATTNATPDFLFESDLGITSAQWAISETGTLVLESAKELHRLTSLVPPVHLCILRAADIRQTLGEILELTSRELSPAVTFITGASRTSDIELTLAIGVHGPGELHVIVLTD